MILYYVHDPMCSWCWGFKPILLQLENNLPDEINIKYVLGGLAEDSDTPMDDDMKNHIITNWRRIQEIIPGIEFNYNFWTKNTPRRSTFPSCRAVLAAQKQDDRKASEMLTAIQESYYLKSLDPSNIDILIELANEIYLDIPLFKKDLMSDDINHLLMEEIKFSRSIGATSFPSLFLEKDNKIYPIVLDYNDIDIILEHIGNFI